MQPLLTISTQTGIFGTINNWNHTCQTDPRMFDYFDVKNPDVIGSLKQIEAGMVVYYKNFVNALIMKAWVTCALDEQCLPRGCHGCKCCSQTGCHRYDQSALNMIVSYFLQHPKSNKLRAAHFLRTRDYFIVSRPQDMKFLNSSKFETNSK
jgi:hypothetical protein